MKKFIFAVAIACACAQFAHAEQVENWFTGGASGTQPTADNGAWTKPDEGVKIADGKFTLELGYDEVLAFTPTANTAPDTNVVTRVVTTAKFVQNAGELPTFSGTDAPKTALIVSNGVFYAYAKVGDKMDWVKLTGDTTPAEDAEMTILTEVDYKRATAYARFAVMNEQTATYLKAVGADDGTWLELGSSPDSGLIAKVSFGGDGELTSVSGNVQLGLFENNGVKYGTADEAVAAAQLAGGSSNIKVLRNNTEKIEIPKGSTIALDTNGKSCGEVDNKSDTPVQIALPSSKEGKGSSTEPFVIDVTVNDPSKVSVYTSDTSKEVALTKDATTGKLVGMVQTSAAIMNEVKFNGKAVADPSTSDYREFLLEHCGTAGSAYMKANTTAAEITAQLNANAGNGLPLWESYVLDLDPDDATSKPAAVVSPTSQSTEGMVLTVPTYKATLPESNYTVKYVLEESQNSGTSWSSYQEYTDATTITVPFNSYQYRVNTVIQ